MTRTKTIILIAAIIALTACAPAAPAVERPPLRVEWTLWPGDYLLPLAYDLGLFEKNGMQVEPVLYEEFDQAIADMSIGKVEAGFFVPGDLLAIARDDNMRAVLVTDTSDGADQIVATADVKTPADLPGKRIGVALGTFGELFVNEMLKQNNINPGSVHLVDITPESVPGSIPDQIDAGHTWEPHTSEALQNGSHVIFTSADTPGLIADLLVFNTKTLEERPEDVRAFIRTWFEALDYLNSHPEESQQIIAKYVNMAPEEVSFEGVKLYSLEDNRNAFQQGDDTTSIHFSTKINLDFLISAGNITTAPDLNLLLDPSYLP
ncbi:MAG: ABC transporter substrate-binding protein [Chloroflexi bacterium]|nr:ABC transporter substrate-binding protein [Chloroflexota bacterium]